MGPQARLYDGQDAAVAAIASGAEVGQTRRSQVALNGNNDAHRLAGNP